MVTPSAENSLNTLLTRCLQETLNTAADSAWGIKPMDTLESVMQKEFIMLTISSYEFRVCILLHFTKDKLTTEYVARAMQTPSEKLEDVRYYDYLGEMGNTFCGAFKRELGKHFPYLGMSTPNRLASTSLKFMQEAAFDYDMHLKASTNDNMAFYSSLYISANKDFDFRVEVNKQDETDAEKGALELF